MPSTRTLDERLQAFGPLIFWTTMFIIGSAIKIVAFDSTTMWFEIAPDAALWASGVLFSLAASGQNLNARAVPRFSPKSSGMGLNVDYDITLPEHPSAGQRFLYFFLLGVAIWIVTLLISEYSSSIAREPGASTLVMVGWTALGIFLAACAVVGAVYSLFEVSK